MKKAAIAAGYTGAGLILAGAFLHSTDMVERTYATIVLIVGAALLATFALMEWGQLKQALERRSTRYGANAAALILILAGILTFVNLIGARYSKRIDMTATNRFSLSELTVNVLNELNQDIHIVAFFRNAGPEAGTRVTLEDLLNQYRYHSRHISYEFIDPDREPGIAREYNISAYGTIVFESETGKTEHITRVTEEALTNAVVRVTREGQKTVYFVEGHGEPGIHNTDRNGFSQLQQALKNQSYEVKTLLLIERASVPEDCDVLVIGGPQKDLLDHEREAILNYLRPGGRALFLLDPPFPEKTADLSGILSAWNVKADDNVVVDVSGVGRFFGAGPLAPAVSNYPAHPITRDFRSATFYPLVRSVDPVASNDSVTVQTIAMTSDRSWADYNPPASQEQPIRFDAGTDVEGPVSVAVAVTADPRGVPRKDMKTLTPQELARNPEAHERKTRMVVVGNSTFATNTYFGVSGNGDFIMNAINWLAEEEDLIAIRPKSSDTRLAQISLTQMGSIFWFTVVIFPSLMLVIGGVVWWNRR